MGDDIFNIVRKAGGGARLTMEQELRRRAEKFADLHEDEGFVYDGIGGVLDKHGIAFEGGSRLPEQYEHLQGPQQMCYLNALHAIEQAPELRYCEGLYMVGGHATNHGWCITPDGGLVDVTFGTDATHVRNDQGAIRRVDPVERWQYVGVIIPTEYAWEIYRNGSLPVLDDKLPYRRDIFKRPWRWDEHGREI